MTVFAYIKVHCLVKLRLYPSIQFTYSFKHHCFKTIHSRPMSGDSDKDNTSATKGRGGYN
jgi:hypothetical protein